MASNFDFDKYNTMTKGIPAGLAVALAKGLLKNAYMSFEFFDNPLADDVKSILVELKSVIDENKAQAAARAAKTGKLMASDGKSE